MPKLTDEEYTNRVWSTMQKMAKLPYVRDMIIVCWERVTHRTKIDEYILKSKHAGRTVRETATTIHRVFVNKYEKLTAQQY